MASQTTLYDSTLESLEKFCWLSSPEIEVNYAQRLDDEYTLQSSREAWSKLRRYVHENKPRFNNALREIPNLETTLHQFLWLQRAIFDPPHPCSLDEASCMVGPSRRTPTMSLGNLIAEIEECAWFFLGILDSSGILVCLKVSCSHSAFANRTFYRAGLLMAQSI
jgi:hypothetical protein